MDLKLVSLNGLGQIPISTMSGNVIFYEHIIRNEKELNKIREYIINNPLRWQLDRENPERIDIDQSESEIFYKSK